MYTKIYRNIFLNYFFKKCIIIFRVLGSLGTSVFDSNVYLVGASGGVYALLAAHLANVMLVSFKLYQFIIYIQNCNNSKKIIFG